MSIKYMLIRYLHRQKANEDSRQEWREMDGVTYKIRAILEPGLLGALLMLKCKCFCPDLSIGNSPYFLFSLYAILTNGSQ